ncbi:uncharacterized protein LOC121977103 isoform X2 [Zingiber officinale]|uniref:uncharacterized protein LOC121977103 isoform X2 n=1 Tax=Zingiber officinale TaxID=94328 RepID=UPI001C4D0B0F|nr:uncharacterized protein LOC121977103 isoform X2 [Zingiber officinale]
MDSFQGRRFADGDGSGGGGDIQQPQQNPFASPYHHQPQSHLSTTSNYPYNPPPPHQSHYPSPPPPPHLISSQHQPPPPPQWVHTDDHFQQQQHHHHHPAPAPPYPPPYAARPVQHQQYPPHHPLQLPPPPPHYSAFPPPPHQGWGGQSWQQNQAWKYQERSLSYNAVDEWAARAKEWATANHQSNSQVVSDGRNEVHSHTYHDQYQATVGPPKDAQQSLLSQSTNQQLPHYTMDQQKQVNHVYPSTSLVSGSTYVGDMHIHSATGEEAVAQPKALTSPGNLFGSTSSIYEQEVPYSYSYVPGNRDSVSQFHLPVLSTREGFVHPPPALTDPNVAVDQHDLDQGRQPTNYTTDPSNMPLDFQPRPVSDLESHPKISYAPIRSESLGMIDQDAISMPAHAWAPPAAPAVLPQVSISGSVTQLDHPFIPHPALGPQPPSVYGRSIGPNFRPGVPPSPLFGLVTGASLNHSSIISAEASSNFNLSERPKKAAVPNWLREEIIKNKSTIASAYASHQNGISYNSMELEDDDKLYKAGDKIGNASADSIKSTEDKDDDEDGAEAARSAAINQEIKRVLTEVLLKVTDELFDEIALKVLDEDDLTDEVTENKEVGNDRVSVSGVSTTNASAKVLVTIKEAKTENGVHANSGMQSNASDILGLASYASDEDDDDADNPKLLLVNESDSRSPENESRSGENEKILINKGLRRGPDGVASGRLETIDSSNSNSRNHVPTSVTIYASLSDGKLPDHAKKQKDPSVTSLQHLPHRNDIPSKITSDTRNASESKGKTISNKVIKEDNTLACNAAGESVIAEEHVRELKKFNGSERYPEKRSYSKESVKESTITDKPSSDSTETIYYENKRRAKENGNEKNNSNDTTKERSNKRGANSKDSNGKDLGSIKDKIGAVKDKKERDKEDTDRKKVKSKDDREGKSRHDTKDPRYISRKSHSQRRSKEGSLHDHGTSSNEPFEVSKRRRMHSRSPPPNRSKTRRSRSGTPVHRRR